MSLTERLSELVRACFTGIWIESHEHEDALAEIARSIATEAGELHAGQEQDQVLDAAVGLTRYEAEAAFSLSLVREGRLTADTLWEQISRRAACCRCTGAARIFRGWAG